jgi:purine-binding chemotaxis protein CheW
LVGLAVGDVLDVAYLNKDEIFSAPAGGVAEKYVKGTASFGGRLMTVLDLGKIFTEGELVVNEET